MFTKRSINEYFEIIKANHKAYLETQMVIHLGIPGTENKKELIDHYLFCINNFRELKTSDINDDLRDSTTKENLERGAFSTFIGMLLGGLFFAAEQRTPSADLFGVKTATQGGFAAAIGASCSLLIYSAWDKSDEKPAHADLKACEAEMEKAGFTDERYKALAAELVKLFHFRECLLLGLYDKSKTNMREAFKSQYLLPGNSQEFNDADLNLSIEVYFLEQLNELFHQAFKKIHDVHAKEIEEEAQSSAFSLWFKRHFESTENRRKFTQEMQVNFIKTCIEFLEEQIHEPGFLGRYLYLVDAMTGLITASLTVGIFAACSNFLPVFALISIGIATAFLTAIGTHLIISLTDSLYYKRSKENRGAMLEVIERITIEQRRLNTLLQTVTITTKKDLAELKKYDENDKSSFLKIIHGTSLKHIAYGSVRAWIREFASRFNESKVVEIDLSDRIKALISGAEDQTVLLQNELLAYMTTKTQTRASLTNLTQVIKDTTEYLKQPENAEFIRTFECVQKIKEQVLEITGLIPSALTQRALPGILVKFYTDPIAEGGLAGLSSDLVQVRLLAPVLALKTAANQPHPYQLFLDTAFEIQLKLNESPNTELIFQGDLLYRNMLGLPSNYTVRIENKINTANITDFLNNSFDFLCSLNQYETNMDWQGAFQNIAPFILYRMLLIKQLAHLADPNNPRVNSLVKEIIKQFARSTLNYNPNVAFDDILNQALLIQADSKGETITDKLGNPRLISELSFIADAVRVDMAYVLTPLSPQQLIALEGSHFLIAKEDKIIFGYNANGKLIPEPSSHFYDKVNDTIQITTDFLAAIQTRTLLQQTCTITLYLQVISNEIHRIKQQSERLKSLLPTSKHSSLDEVLSALNAFKQTASLPEPEALTVNTASPPQPTEITSKSMTKTKKSSLWSSTLTMFGVTSKEKTTNAVKRLTGNKSLIGTPSTVSI